MALIVEDGTGKPDAESYVSVADFKAYADARGLSYGTKSDTEIEQALRRATEWLDAKYGGRFGGTWAVTGQALAWPRFDAVYRGTFIPITTIPVQIVAATSQAAVRELNSPGSLSPDVTPGKIKKRVRVESAVEVEYAVGSAGVASQTPVVSIIDGILAGLLMPSGGLYSGRAVRG